MVRVEVWKGYEYQPVVKSITVAASQLAELDIEIERSVRRH